jgi:hypothetical protein
MRALMPQRELAAMRNQIPLALIVGVAMALAGGCSRILDDALNPKYCDAHPTDPDCRQEFPDAYTGCMSNAQCSTPTPVCLVEQMTCVQCTATDPGACTGNTPACKLDQMTCVQCTAADARACVGNTPVCGANDACRACTAHTDCASSACLPSGACGDDTNVAYVDPAGTGTTCTKARPCMKVDDALKTGRQFIKFHGTTNEQLSLTGRNVTFLADPDAQLTEMNSGILLKIDGMSQVTIYDLEITGSLGTNNPAISLQAGNTANVVLVRAKLTSNSGPAILANGGTVSISESTISGNRGAGISFAGSSLSVTQSTISGNDGAGISITGSSASLARSTIFGNAGGGILLQGSSFSITNNFVYRNGNTIDANIGGVGVTAVPPGTSKLEFNTIVDNQARVATTSVGGVLCDETGFVAAHNIIFRNTGGMAGNVQTLGICTYADSLNMPGTSNIDNSPGFVHPNATPFDYHLTPASPATIVNAAGACTGVDFDGDMRPIGAACDLGADERMP